MQAEAKTKFDGGELNSPAGAASKGIGSFRDPRKRRLTLAAVLLVVACLVAYFQPMAPVDAHRSGPGEINWWLYPHETNRGHRQTAIYSDLRDVVVVPESGDVWTVGTRGGIFRSRGGDEPFERINVTLSDDDLRDLFDRGPEREEASSKDAKKFMKVATVPTRKSAIRQPFRLGQSGPEQNTSEEVPQGQPNSPTFAGELALPPVDQRHLNSNLNVVCALDAKTLWVGGDHGLLLNTVDGGEGWQLQEIATRHGINEVAFSSASEGWALSSKAELFRTTNGGQEWVLARSFQCDAPRSGHSVGMQVDSDGRGWLAVDEGLFEILGDRIEQAESWIKDGVSRGAISFSSHQDGWVGGDVLTRVSANGEEPIPVEPEHGGFADLIKQDQARGLALDSWADDDTTEGSVLRYTANGGQDWQPVHESAFSQCAIALGPKGTVWSVGWGGTIYRLEDPETDEPTESLLASRGAGSHPWPLVMHDDGLGWYRTREGYYRTRDHGESWEFDPKDPFEGLAFAIGSEWGVVGFDPSFDQTRASAWGSKEWSLPIEKGLDDLGAFYAVGPSLHLVGDDGEILRLNVEANRWERAGSVDSSVSDLTLRSMQVSVGRAVPRLLGRDSQYEFDAAGSSWKGTRLDQPVPEDLDLEILFDCGQGGIYALATSQPQSLIDVLNGSRVTLPMPIGGGGFGLIKVHALTPENIWYMVGGRLWETTNRGSDWTEVEFDVPGSVGGAVDIARIDEKIAFVALAPDRLIKTTDGGESWSAVLEHSRAPAPWFWLCVLGSIALAVWSRFAPAPVSMEPSKFLGWIVSDRPLEVGDPDPLNFDQVAHHLERFLTNPATEPPLTIGITGEWGSGKSSLMNLLQSRVSSERGFQTVWFNAWHHQNEEQLLAALLMKIKEHGVPSILDLQGIKFRFNLLRIRLKRSYLKIGTWAAIAALVPQVIDFVASNWPPLAGLLESIESLKRPELATYSIYGALLPVFVSFFKGIRAFGADPSQLASVASKGIGEKELGFRTKFEREFGEVTEALGQRRLMVLIDDLDRCHPKSVANVLESINFLSTCGDVIVVLGMDEQRVLKCVGESFKEVAEADYERFPGEGDAEKKRNARKNFSSRYMEKLINMRVAVPVFGAKRIGTIFDPKEMVSHQAAAQKRRRKERGDRLRRLVGEAAVLSCILLLPFCWFFFAPVTKVAEVAAQDVSTTIPPNHRLTFKPDGEVVLEMGASEEEAAGNAEPDSELSSRDAGLDAGPEEGVEEEAARVEPQFEPEWPPRDLVVARPADSYTGEVASPWKSLTPIVLVFLFLALAWRLRPKPSDPPKDSKEFEEAVADWYPVVYLRHRTPRVAKRFVNRARYQAMAPDLLSADGAARASGSLNELEIVAFGALESFNESLVRNRYLWDQFHKEWEQFQKELESPPTAARRHQQRNRKEQFPDLMRLMSDLEAKYPGIAERLSNENRARYLGTLHEQDGSKPLEPESPETVS